MTSSPTALPTRTTGRRDLRAGVIRAIGDPAERFREDGLRPLRACRFAAQLGFVVEQATREAIPGSLDILARVSAERVRDEILKILQSPVPSVGLALMKDTGILAVVLPELLEGEGVAQGSFHCYDVFWHSLYACDAAPRESPILRLAALLHDVGKPRTRADAADGRPTFYGHEKVSAEMTQAILERLKLPNAVIREVAHLVSHHMFNYQDEWSDAAVRRLIARVGEGIDRGHHRAAPGGPGRDVQRERAVLSRRDSSDFAAAGGGRAGSRAGHSRVSELADRRERHHDRASGLRRGRGSASS